MVHCPPSSRPSPQGEGETPAAYLEKFTAGFARNAGETKGCQSLFPLPARLRQSFGASQKDTVRRSSERRRRGEGQGEGELTHHLCGYFRNQRINRDGIMDKHGHPSHGRAGVSPTPFDSVLRQAIYKNIHTVFPRERISVEFRLATRQPSQLKIAFLPASTDGFTPFSSKGK
jgi:hypothetical protein